MLLHSKHLLSSLHLLHLLHETGHIIGLLILSTGFGLEVEIGLDTRKAAGEEL
jgi:hypothetical protein